MATRTISLTAGAWSSTGAWVEGVVPTASDDVVATATSGALTINAAGAVCRSADFTNYISTFTLSGGNPLSIGTSTANGTTALKLVAGMTFTPGISIISFVSTSATQLDITTAGKTMGALTFNGAGGSWRFVGTTTSNDFITLTAGSLDTNGVTVSSLALLASGSTTRSLTLGATAWTVSLGGSSAWDMTTATGLTFSGASSSITFSGNGGGINGGSKAFGSITFTGSGVTDVNAVTSAVNVTRNGTAVKTERLRFVTAITISTLLTATGNSAINRLFIENGTSGTVGTTVTAAAVSLSNVDFARITGAGAASPFTGTSIGNSGTTSGITFTAAVTRFWVASGGTSTGNWSDTNHWAATGGGGGGQSVPLPQDTVRFDPSSIDAGSRTITGDMPRYGNSVDWTGATNSPTWNITAAGNASSGMTGDLTLIGAMTLSGTLQLVPSVSTAKITSNAATITASINLQGHSGAKTTLQDNLTTTSTITLNDVELDTNGKAVSCTRFISSLAAHPRVVTLGASVWTVTSTGNVIDFASLGSLTFSAATGKFVLSDTSATSKTIRGGGVNLNGAGIELTGGGTGAAIVSGSNTIGTFKALAPKTVTWTSADTQAITNLIASGDYANKITFAASTGGSAAIVRAAASTVAFVTATDINSSGGAGQPITDLNGIDGGGNTNWTFTPGATSIASTEAFGAGTLLDTLPGSSSINSAEAFDSGALTEVITGTSINSAEAFDSGALTEVITGTSINSAEAFGSGVLLDTIPGSTSINSAEAFDAGTLLELITGTTSIGSAEAFSSGSLAAAITGTSINSAEAFGSGVLLDTIPGSTSINSEEAFDSGALTLTVVGVTPIPSAETFDLGTVVATVVITGTSINSAEAFGSGVLLDSIPGSQSITSAEAFGTPAKLTRWIIGINGIPSEEAFGQSVFFYGIKQPTKVLVTSPRRTRVRVTS